jgi:hypothetical protein
MQSRSPAGASNSGFAATASPGGPSTVKFVPKPASKFIEAPFSKQRLTQILDLELL